jgi:hypothetical protein
MQGFDRELPSMNSGSEPVEDSRTAREKPILRLRSGQAQRRRTAPVSTPLFPVSGQLGTLN